jgi:hypothetical protein
MLAIFTAGDAKHSAIFTEVYVAATTKMTFGTIDRRIESYPFSDVPPFHLAAKPLDCSGRFMAHDNRRNSPTGTAIHPMHIATADSTGSNPQEHILWTTLWFRHVFVGKRLVFFEHQRFHRIPSGHSGLYALPEYFMNAELK